MLARRCALDCMGLLESWLTQMADQKQIKTSDDYSTPEPSAKKMKLSFGALTSLEKSKERPSAAQSPRSRLSAVVCLRKSNVTLDIHLLTAMKIR